MTEKQRIGPALGVARAGLLTRGIKLSPLESLPVLVNATHSDGEIMIEADLDDWGPWKLDTEHLVLVREAPRREGGGYEVDLEECKTSAEVLDWICQVAMKLWADERTVAGLVRAIQDILNPQAHLCSSGKSRTLSRARIAELANQADARRRRL